MSSPRRYTLTVSCPDLPGIIAAVSGFIAQDTSFAVNKPNIQKAAARLHVDVFAITESFTLDDEVSYRDGAWKIGYQ